MRMIDHFHEGMRRSPDRPAFVDDEKGMTFREVDDFSARLKDGLHGLGFTTGTRIAVYAPNDALAMACVVGVMRSGAVWLPLNWRNSVEVNAAFLRLAECEVLFFHSSLAAEAASLQAQVDTLTSGICIDQGPGADVSSGMSALLAAGTAVAPEVPDDPDHVLALFPTGGTTGLSKAVPWTQRMWTAATAATLACCPPRSRSPVHLVAAPMTHAAGALALWMTPSATTSVLVRKADPAIVMQAVEQHRVTHLYLPPTVIYAMLVHPDVSTVDFSSLEYLLTASAPISPDKLEEALHRFNTSVCQAYGQVEAPLWLTFLSAEDLVAADRTAVPDRFASCGRVVEGSAVEIMSDDGEILGSGQRGEIVARGPLVFDGYCDNPTATEETARFGWHHTGDVGFKDVDGYVYIVDRKKDMIITGGFNVYSAEVEQVILGHPAVLDGVVIGVPDQKWGEAVKAVVQCRAGQSVSADELCDLVRAALGGVHTPKSVEFWDDLPRSSNGKVLKKEVRRRFWAGSARAV
jgi:acyl-CoA synthetase (AMP-forming)/AMP-acid ligase II